ncbi:hypothetical protein COCC4DRAFT_59606 [Bipolaris maydis ATCC 48331]|uniref:Uncharacterized protein n=2 Tax=Cochliobolus heterostrophus TaxID=5016 RepID=M2TWS1_COCH5|nr:uncharacterized protein COCC4DRAFT_59606 [Bipolaris maydis ATCC 48331]EMD86181.1 hypothetical protein COCHEDRAFT_1034645 [Bipolaris maydis C5]ENI06130.1 hypothetical protein COCC4DRAFT_59606 [Bipolaris maydis ATCC 48331]KAJ6213817.1 hypothetical protein PSV09DRAFT_1034645 [Bipolaris maydis]
MTILVIPFYYQKSDWLSYPYAPRYCTTTAEYIALPPSTNPIITTRNDAIAKDATAWGWHIYNVDVTSPKMKKNAGLGTKLQQSREHGVRITEEDAKKKATDNESESKMDAVIRGVKKIGQ